MSPLSYRNIFDIICVSKVNTRSRGMVQSVVLIVQTSGPDFNPQYPHEKVRHSRMLLQSQL